MWSIKYCFDAIVVTNMCTDPVNVFVQELAFVLIRVDPDSALHSDLVTYKEKEGKDHILLNFTYRVSVEGKDHILLNFTYRVSVEGKDHILLNFTYRVSVGSKVSVEGKDHILLNFTYRVSVEGKDHTYC